MTSRDASPRVGRLDGVEGFLARRWRVFLLDGQEAAFVWDAGAGTLLSVPASVVDIGLKDPPAGARSVKAALALEDG